MSNEIYSLTLKQLQEYIFISLLNPVQVRGSLLRFMGYAEGGVFTEQ